MKKTVILLFSIFCLSSILSANNQLKIAILELRSGVGMQQSRVEGLADMLTLELYQSGHFSIIERTQVQQVLKANNFTGKQLSLKEQQYIGEKLKVDAVLIGTVNYIVRDTKLASDGDTKFNSGEYNVSIRLVSVSDGSVLSSAGTDGRGRRESEIMKEIAVQLAQNLDSQYIEKKIHLLYDYLYVYPEDLGTFSSNPELLINITNKNAAYGYTDWRLPTQEEMSLLEANTRLISLNRSTSYAYQNIWNYQKGNFTVRLVRSKVVTQQKISNSSMPYFENETYDFGIIPILSGTVSGFYRLQNPSQDNIYIKNVITTNSSIRISWDKGTILPGEFGTINISYNPNGRQGVTLNHTINVELSNGQRFTLYVRGRVK